MDEGNEKQFEFRAKLPGYVRIASLGVIGVTVLLIAVGFYQQRNQSPFRLKPEHTQLSKDVVAEINGYERLEADGDAKKYYIKADHAKTFSDNHQELDNVYIEVFGPDGAIDKLSAQKALYVPEQDRNFTAYLAGDVDIETRDSLRVRTSNIIYTKKDEIATADEAVEFERANMTGRSVGANVYTASKKLELLKDVEIDMTSDESGQTGVKKAHFSGASAIYDRTGNTLEVKDGVDATMTSAEGQRETRVKANRLLAALIPSEESQPSLRDVQLFDNVWIETTFRGTRQTTIETGYAFYDKPADRFELKNGVHVVTGADDPADSRSESAVYEQGAGRLQLNGSVEISKGVGYVKGDSVFATLTPEKKIRDAKVYGSAYVRNSAPERRTEISSNELTINFDDYQQPQRAAAFGNTSAVVTPTDATEYTSLRVSTPGRMTADFKTGGLPSKMDAQDRATLQLNVPGGAEDASNKRVTADRVGVTFNENGKDIRHAEAVGNAELFIEPIHAAENNYRSTIFAPRFDCEFYPTGNNARQCTGAKNTKTVRVPTVASDGRGTQTLVAEQLTADFSQSTNGIEALRATGQTKFSELDRNAMAETMTFTQNDQTLRLRGGEPTFWDANSRARAPEIDWNTGEQRSALRGGVSTTYYSRKKTGNAAPFSSPDKPVFATAASLDVDHRSETAVYTGNARAWQDNNYVRADKLVIDQRNGKFAAEGAVQSLLYEARQRRKGTGSSVPVSATAGALYYSRDARVLQYRNSVDIRQGSDRMLSDIADIYLDDNNEMVRTVVEKNVIITQPGRKATGDWAEYDAQAEVAVIRGNPARVDDAQSGTSQSGRLTVYLRENRVLAEGPTTQNPSARTRSVYKVKNSQ